MFRSITPALFAVAVIALAACGDDGASAPRESDRADRTVEVDMVDLAFEPSDLTVRAGETVRFVFINTGDVPHDAFIGDAEEQADHAAEMDDVHGHGADDGQGVTVEPGERAELTRTFTADDDELLIGCHQPGHYEAGMVTPIRVS